jgi:hypothetical protein
MNGCRARSSAPGQATWPMRSAQDARTQARDVARDYEASIVRDLAAARGEACAATLGPDGALATIQDGHTGEPVVAHGLTGSLRRCGRCGKPDRSADPVCVACGAGRRWRTLHTLPSELAGLNAVRVEIVAGKAAKELRAAEALCVAELG